MCCKKRFCVWHAVSAAITDVDDLNAFVFNGPYVVTKPTCVDLGCAKHAHWVRSAKPLIETELSLAG